MGYAAYREASNRYSAPSSYDFTNSGANTETTLQIVKLDSNGKVTPSTASTDKHIGVILNNPAVGDTADVLLINNMGTGRVQSSGAVNIGDYLTANASGLATTTTSSGDIIIGQAVSATSAANQVVEYISYRAKI